MGWLQVVALVFTYGPELIAALKSLIDAIKSKNAEKGVTAVSGAAELAGQIVRSYQTRSGLTNDQKREMSWQDLIAGMKSLGVTLSETNARTLVQLAYQNVSGK